MAVTVLVLESFAGERGAPRRAAEQKAARAHVGRGPDKIRDALEAEHRVIDEERNRIDSVRRVGRARSDARSHRAGFGDAFFQNLAVLRFFVIKQRVYVHWLILLADAGINAGGTEKRFHAKGASFVRNDWHDEFADLRILEHLAKHSHERHGRGNFPAVAAFQEFPEEFVVVGGQGFRTNAALGNVAAQRFAPRAKVLNLDAILGRPVKRDFDAILVVQGNAEARAELAQLVLVEFLLLVRDVLAFARFAKTVALDGARKNDRRRALVIDSRFIRRIDLARIVSAEAQPPQTFIGHGLDKLKQTRITSEEMLANVRARGNDQLLVFAVHQFAHALHQQPFGVAFEDGVPLASPQDLDDVPSSPAKGRFQFLNNLSIPAYRSVKSLQIAVDHEDQIVELFARSERNRSE